jgi:hypothetical protein
MIHSKAEAKKLNAELELEFQIIRGIQGFGGFTLRSHGFTIRPDHMVEWVIRPELTRVLLLG